jgi:Holliday junction resolvase RusA-like endonuclease
MSAFSFKLDIAIPSKKNRYMIRFNPRVFRAISPILRNFKKPHYWIGPAKEVTDAETAVAWAAKMAPNHMRGLGRKHLFEGDLRVTIKAYGKVDAGNLEGVIGDGLEQSGRIKNDRQIKELHIYRLGPGKGCEVTVEEL